MRNTVDILCLDFFKSAKIQHDDESGKEMSENAKICICYVWFSYWLWYILDSAKSAWLPKSSQIQCQNGLLYSERQLL